MWVTLPEYVDTGSMLAEALDAGVTYVPGDSFYPDGEQGKNCMRINFSYETPENITEAIRRLANRHRGSPRAVPRVHRGGAL